MHGWICKSCGNRILENGPDEHNEDCPMQRWSNGDGTVSLLLEVDQANI